MDLANEILTELAVEFGDEPDYNVNVLKVKINQAIRKVRTRRNYAVTDMSEEDIQKDLYNYYSVIFALAEYYYNQRGGEYESQHSEDGVNRTWIKEEELLRGVYAYVKVL